MMDARLSHRRSFIVDGTGEDRRHATVVYQYDSFCANRHVVLMVSVQRMRTKVCDERWSCERGSCFANGKEPAGAGQGQFVLGYM